MQNKLAVLIALAKRPQRRATLHELRDDIVAAEADKDIGSAQQQYSFDHIDVFQTGLVVVEGDSLVITESGCALLKALGIVQRDSPDLDLLTTVQSLNLIDDLIGAEAHRKIFDVQSRSDDQDADGLREGTFRPEAPADQMGGMENRAHEAHPSGDESRAAADNVDKNPPAPPAFLAARFGSGIQPPPGRRDFRTRIATLMKRSGSARRNHLRQDKPQTAASRSSTNGERIVFALLSLLVFASAAGATIAFVHVRNTKAELAALQRELLPLKERLAKLELVEMGRNALDRPSNFRRQTAVEERAAEPALLLSREEIQVIRDYIKPAPIAGGSSMPPIGVGDPVIGPTLPFPTSVTEKVPKLIGVKFTIRNGAIVIVSKDGRRADVVLAQN